MVQRLLMDRIKSLPADQQEYQLKTLVHELNTSMLERAMMIVQEELTKRKRETA